MGLFYFDRFLSLTQSKPKIQKMFIEEKISLCEHLKQYFLDERVARFEQVLKQRTSHISVVLEDIFQSHNASAVLRSCECFGVQHVHFIENENIYQANPEVAMGAQKWLNIHHHNHQENNTIQTIESLKKEGYRIVATTPHTNDILLEDLDISPKTVLLFGTEQKGLSQNALDHADAFLRIPMYGFTESFNISVSVAICLYHLTAKLRKTNIDWELSQTEYIDILFEWLKNNLKSADEIIKKWQENR